MEREGTTIRWTNTSFDVSAAEAREMADRIREMAEQPGVDALLVDNEAAEGTWPQETNEVWDELMADLYAAGVTSATLSPSVTNAMQVNRLSRDNDTYDKIRAFQPDERDAAHEFAGIGV